MTKQAAATQVKRVPLTLRCLGGLTTGEVARAFLVPEATAAQRIARAKRTLTERRVVVELPDPAQMADRLASVLEVVYLVFNEGFVATAGDDWMRPALCEEAMRLGRVLAALAPAEPEVHGLLALMEIQASRLPARSGSGVSRCCSPIRTGGAGTGCSSAAASRLDRVDEARAEFEQAASLTGNTRERALFLGRAAEL